MYAEDRPDVASDEGDAEREAPCGPLVAVCASRVGCCLGSFLFQRSEST